MQIFIIFNLFMDVLEKIICWHSDNVWNSSINMGMVQKKPTHFPQPGPCAVSMFPLALYP